MRGYIFSKNIIVLILIASFLFSCSKFEDGPLFSFQSVESRIAREWKVEYVLNLNTGISHSADYEGWLLKIDKGGSFVNTIFYAQLETKVNGKWEMPQKNIFRMEYGNSTNTQVEFYTILRLTKNELWIKDGFQEIHYYSN